MADREPSRKNSQLNSPGGDAWLNSTQSVESEQSETFGFDFDLSSAINDTFTTAKGNSDNPASADLADDDIIILDEADVEADPLAVPVSQPVASNLAPKNLSPNNPSAAKSQVQAMPVKAVGQSGLETRPTDGKTEPTNVVANAAAMASVAAAAVGHQEEPVRVKGLGDKILTRSVPSWAISLILHVAIFMVLAAIQVEPVQNAIGMVVDAVANEDVEGLDEGLDMSDQSIAEPMPAASLDQSMSSSAAAPFSASDIALTDTASLVQPMEATVDVGTFGAMVENIVPSSALNASTSRLSGSLMGRSTGSMKSELLERFGGNAASEKSVSMALDWLARHQDRSGGWTFGHSAVCRGECKGDGKFYEAVNGATALALLPFLGAGQTHLEGKYKTTVQKGLTFLISRMKVTGGDSPNGSWHEARGNMYSHGLASIVVCEAYAMTRDPNLLQPAQLAVNYIAYAQDPRGGGWRYSPKQPGDTSVVGWQLMALKSGAMGNLAVPPECFRKADTFLNFISVNDGAYYGYDQPTSNFEGRGSTTAVGLLCRMYLGWPKDKPGLKTGIEFLAKRGPNINDLYYSYYATQVLRQYGGDQWTNWNKTMRDTLIKAQETEGHAAGSWYIEKGPHHDAGGRLYCTAMCTMMLEVYYRHMPLYSEKSSDEEFEF